MQNETEQYLHLRDYGYGTNSIWSSRMISLIDAVMDWGIMEVMERLKEVGKYHSAIRQDARDLKILFPLSEEELRNNYKNGIPNIIRMLEYTEDQHKDMARKVIANYENNEMMMPDNKKQKIGDKQDDDKQEDNEKEENDVTRHYVSETDYDSEEPDYEKCSIIESEAEETIEVISVKNSPIGSLDPLPTEDELKQNAEFLIYDTHDKMLGMFSRFIEQFQNKEMQEEMSQKISGYLNEFIEYKSYCVDLAYEELTQKLKDLLHEEDRKWSKEEQKLFETAKCLSCEKIEEYAEGIEHAKNLAKKRRKSLLELKKLDKECFNTYTKEYKQKYDFYIKKKKEKTMEIQDLTRKIKDLERQIESVKDHKSMLRQELNLKEIRVCNETLRKIYKKIYGCYASIGIMRYEQFNYEILGIGLDIV